MKASVLVVDDDGAIQRTVVQALEKEGYAVRAASSAEDALAQLRRSVPDLAVLDVRMPGMDGFDLCRKMRETAEWREVSVIFLTSKGEEASRILGLELGGDDYIIKPFSIMELVARTKAVLRRRRGGGEAEVLREGSVTVDVARHSVATQAGPVKLPAKEFDLLCALLRRKGRLLSRAVLMESVWGQDYTATTRTVDTHIYRLRKHLGAAGRHIQSVGKMGYKWEEE